ncbi:hypothetical protein ON010_g9287 [Phytophthora cinnamomi]|nr:hypothetical protein ON010_g9287 [Phytophthora cinnamomi]
MKAVLLAASTALAASWSLPSSVSAIRMRPDGGPLFASSKMVKSLDVDSFSAMLNDSQTVWLVDFYSPWCPHCRQFAPQWEEVANVYADVATVQLGAVDCTEQNEICDREDVHSYPGVKMYHVTDEAIVMPHARHVYARQVARWLEEMLKENNMQSGIDIDKVYTKNPLREDLKKKEFKFGDPVEPPHDDRSAEIQLNRLKDAAATTLLTFEDGAGVGVPDEGEPSGVCTACGRDKAAGEVEAGGVDGDAAKVESDGQWDEQSAKSLCVQGRVGVMHDVYVRTVDAVPQFDG